MKIARTTGVTGVRFGMMLLALFCVGSGAADSDSQTNSWSLQPLRKPSVPSVRDNSWPRTAIDRFIVTKLEENRLKPSPIAEKRLLLRRVTFDLIGLPPTHEEVEGFLSDNSAEAYQRVVDRLLGSPRYGERWARHWLDVVHYADTHGNDQDRIRTNAWPYRDYLVRAFNEDKPYARFVQEQIAGDVLFPDDPQGIVATGFIAAGPWDESSQLNIMDDTVDKKVAKNLDRDDIVTTTISTFASSTVHCARCHNHKFDPISQQDYYSLQAVFAGIDRANRSYDPDPKTHQLRRALLKRKASPPTDHELQSLAAERARWEATVASSAVVWRVLDPISFTSSNGTTLAKQSDLSLLASGKRPETDTYTIIAETETTDITAVRLEVLADESLPHKGPGRQDNGNLHLSEFRLQAAPRTKAGSSSPSPLNGENIASFTQFQTTTNVPLQNPSADFDQAGWQIDKALDANLKTAWGIYPEVGKSHFAVFELKRDAGFSGGTRLTFALEQLHGGGHLIGRPRLSITSSPRPVRAKAIPDQIAAILAMPGANRSAQQQRELALYHRNLYLDQQLAALPPPQLVYAAASDFVPEGNFKPAKTPRPIHVLKRGDINKPGDLAEPGALSCVSSLNPRFDFTKASLASPLNGVRAENAFPATTVLESESEGARRAALAKWLTDSANPLTWRSIVNRIWHYHFGRGIADSPNDLGHMGGQPSHPELLDWLARTFIESGGSLKQLHRLIVTSSVYMQSSRNNSEFAKIDGSNIYLWRMNRTRLDAESIRDAVLAISGKLDLQMGGPAARQFALKPGIHVTPEVDYNHFDVDSRDSCRRSVYRFIFRTLPDPFMDSMDCADASQLTPARNSSVTALQALSMLNNHFIVRYSEHFASRLTNSPPSALSHSDRKTKATGVEQQIRSAFDLAYNRAPDPVELELLCAYATRHGMANLCRLILNSNEFVFVN